MPPTNNYFPNFSAHGYQIIQELGHNLNGGRVTYLAREVATEQSVVIKQFQFARTGASWSGYTAMQREIEVLQQLNHPGIPQYLGSFETGDGFCLVQEYKDAQALSVKRSFSLDEIKEITIKTLEILIYLQSLSPPVIHRDLKPENILVDNELNVYLVDFGFARIGGEDLSMSSVVVGTTGFMPPEQLLNQRLTAASDLYGLGATIVCLLSGIKSSALSKYIDHTYCIDVDKLLHFSVDFNFKQWLKKLIAPRLSVRFSNARIALEVLQQLDVTLSSTDDGDTSSLNRADVAIAATAGAGIISVANITIFWLQTNNLITITFALMPILARLCTLLVIIMTAMASIVCFSDLKPALFQYRKGDTLQKSFAPVMSTQADLVIFNILLKLLSEIS